MEENKVKKLILAAVLTICMAAVAQADMFNNNIETWETYGGGGTIFIPSQYPSGWFEYEHTLLNSTPSVDIVAGDIVTNATLTLGFIFDNKPYTTQYTATSLEGSAWTLQGTTNPVVIPNINIDWLNTDGVLSVRISVSATNYPAGVDLDYSRLCGDYTPATVVPVPAAGLLCILGLGAAGLKLRKTC
jgi:hypothetical protein